MMKLRELADYEKLAAADMVFSRILQLGLDKYMDREDYKIRPPIKLDMKRPWINIRSCQLRQCSLMLEWYNWFAIVPSMCRNCWKVFYQPQSLAELIDVFDKAEEAYMTLASRNLVSGCKGGLEKRGITGRVGGYNMFWYVPLDKTEVKFDTLKAVRRLVPRPDDVHLKRGCTELERHTKQNFDKGSDGWDELAEDYNKVEAILQILFAPLPPIVKFTPPMVRTHVLLKWIEFAFEHGDQSYRNFAPDFKVPLKLYDNEEKKVEVI